jgi:GTP-binding protein
MLETWEEVPQYFVTSSLRRIGHDEILAFIEKVNTDFYDSL